MWRAAKTSTHQDHVIAHVIGATVLSHFVWDETVYLVLDIGFIWNVYLDGEMGLVPEQLAMAELRANIDQSAPGDFEKLTRPIPNPNPSPIQSVEFLENDNARRLVLNCENETITLEMSFLTRDIQIDYKE
jgi:hypothetical protein